MEPQSINKKRGLRVMREHNLLVPSNWKLKATRTPSRSKPRPTKPQEGWSIDMTKVMVEDFGWVYIVVVLAWYTKNIVNGTRGMGCPRCVTTAAS